MRIRDRDVDLFLEWEVNPENPDLATPLTELTVSGKYSA